MFYIKTVTDWKGDIVWANSDCTIPQTEISFESELEYKIVDKEQEEKK